MNIVDIISGVEEFKVRFKDAAENIDKATAFWNSYNHQPLELLRSQQYHVLRDRMFKLLRTCKQINQETFEKIHKGHPYFFIMNILILESRRGPQNHYLCNFLEAVCCLRVY